MNSLVLKDIQNEPDLEQPLDNVVEDNDNFLKDISGILNEMN